MKFYILLYCLFCSTSMSLALKVYEYFPDIFYFNSKECNLISKLLKENPIEKNISFVCAPWPILLKNTDLNKTPNIHDLAHLKFNNAFVVCSFDDYERLIPFFKSIGVKVIFSAAGNGKKYDGIDTITIPYFAHNTVKPNNKKDIFYSFIGTTETHKCRESIFKTQHPKNCVIIKRDSFHYTNKNKKLLKKMSQEYADVLSRSRFSLCPRGVAAGSYRFWESLYAGAIPVLISDEYILPTGFDWDSCIIRIKESEVNKIPSILSKIPIDVEIKMRTKCLIAYSYYSNNNLDRLIRRYYRYK